MEITILTYNNPDGDVEVYAARTKSEALAKLVKAHARNSAEYKLAFGFGRLAEAGINSFDIQYHVQEV